MTLTSNFFDVVLFLFSSLFTGPSFMSICRHVITGSEIITIFFYKGLTRNPEMGNTPVWVLPNIWRLGRVIDTTFGTNVSNIMLLNPEKFQGYSFYPFWVIQGKPTGGGVKLPRPLTKIRVKIACRVKTNTAWTTKNITSFNYFSKKINTSTLEEHKRNMKIFELKINEMRTQIIAAKMT